MLKFFDSLDQAIKDADGVVVIAAESHYAKGVPQKVIPGKHWDLAGPALSDLKNIKKPQVLKTLTGEKKPRQFAAAVLPTEVSRGNSPTRKQWLYQVADDIEALEKSLVVLVLDDPAHYVAAAGALARRQRMYNLKSERKEPRVSVVAFDASGKVIAPTPRVEATGRSVAWTCRITDTAPSDMNPKAFAAEIKDLVKGRKDVSVTELVGDQLVAEGLNGVYSVGKCAVEAPRIVVLDYKPSGAKKTVALIGKGVTYDTGGLNIKTNGNMVGMKMDLGGAAAVIGAFFALVEAGASERVIATVGIVENAIGPGAYKPDDILKMHSGKTVEVNNTDAEGRLVLADCLSYTCRKFKPDAVMEAATLTGAQLIATGMLHAGIVSNDDRVEEIARVAGRATGDLVAPLPFAPEFFQDEFTSAVADMRNSVKNRANAQSSCAAQFIYSHIDDLGIPWLHIDLAGPATDEKGLGTGFGVALMAEIVQALGRS